MHKTQLALLELAKLGQPISRRELCKKLGISSTGVVNHHVNKLLEAGHKLPFEKKQYGIKKYLVRKELIEQLEETKAFNKEDIESMMKGENYTERGIGYAEGVIDCCDYLIGLFKGKS